MTTTANGKTYTPHPVKITWSAEFIAIRAGSQELRVDQSRYNDVSFDDDEQSAYDSLKKEGNGRTEFSTTMIAPVMNLWVSIKEKLGSVPAMTPGVPVQPPAPAPAPLPPEPVCVPPVPIQTPANDSLFRSEADIIASLAPTVQDGATDGATESPAARKKIKDGTNEFIYAKVLERSRQYGIDDLEGKIRTLREAERKLSKDATILSYDIPAVMRAVMPEVTGFLWAAGLFAMNESVFWGTNEAMESGSMESLFTYFEQMNTRFKGVMYRDGRAWKEAQINYSKTEVSEKQRGSIKSLASDALREMLVSAHASLIVGLYEATEEFKQASAAPCFTEGPRKGQEKTEKDRLNEQRAHDNKFRTELRSAAETLNLAVQCAENYDANMEDKDLCEGLRKIIASRRNSFNVETRKREAKGIEV